MNRIYLDCAATTPIDKEVQKAMETVLSDEEVYFGNPNSLHFFGQKTRGLIDAARENISKLIGAEFDEIIFTGSATEANNLALRGVVKKLKRLKAESGIKILVSAIEHESILETVKDLEDEGIEIGYIPVDKNGIVDLEKLKTMLDERTALVSVMYVNNEVGSIQPIKEISKLILEYKKEKAQKGILSVYPLLHTDAVQAFNYLDCNVKDLGVDIMTLSGHKIYGPKGIGLLYARKNKLAESKQSYFIDSIITGGGQEFNLRSGTQNMPYIAGMAKAAEISQERRSEENERLTELRNYFAKEILNSNLTAVLHNNFIDTPQLYAPHIINFGFSDRKANELLIALDLKGLAVSAGSACMAYVAKPSYVLKAMGKLSNEADSAIRISLGRFTAKQDIDEAIKRMLGVLKK